MFCTYCMVLNPDDAIYCCKCGRAIESLSEEIEDVSQPQGREMPSSENLDSDFDTEPSEDTSPRDYGRMDDEELAQLQEAYRKLRLPLPSDLQDELRRRYIKKRLAELEVRSTGDNGGTSSPAAVADDLRDDRFDNSHLTPPTVPQTGWRHTLVKVAVSMSQKQRASIFFGLSLIVLSLLFPPLSVHYSGIPRLTGASDSVSWGLLFTANGKVDLGRLFVEWVLIALITSVLFFSRTESHIFNSGKVWKRKFLILLSATLAICAVGLAYYGSRRITRDLPPTEVSKLAGEAYITNYGHFEWKAYNGSNFVLTEVRVSISVFDEKGNAVISHRVYRVPAFAFYPQQTKELSADVGFTLGEGQKWEFAIVGAKGRPE